MGVRFPPPQPVWCRFIAMARSHLKMLDFTALERFVKRVEEMRAEGLQTWAIADALGVPKSTLNDRLRKWKNLLGV